MPKVASTVRVFAPEQWGEVDRFIATANAKYTFKEHQWRVLSGVRNHLHKALTLLGIANNLVPTLDDDHAELGSKGFTRAQNSRNLAAVLEGVITEIYSSVDCTSKVLFFVYGPNSRGFKESTRKLFTDFDKISGSFPENLKLKIGLVDWYEDLRHIRDELTHRDVGSCSLDRETGKITYFHSGLRGEGRLLPIDDIFYWVNSKLHCVNEFIGVVFNELNKTIVSGEVQQVCGFVDGRVLIRLLDVSKPIDFNNGTCMSAQWFTEPSNPTCPFYMNCDAFNHRASKEKIQNHFRE